MKIITKKIRLHLAALALVASGSQMAHAQCNGQTYVTPNNNCGIDYISNVKFHTINRTSGCDPLAVYTTPNPTVMCGFSYTLSVTTGGDVEGVRAWIDYDGDGVFNNTAPELVLGPLYAGTNPATYSTVVTIPLTATPGTTRLRVRCNFASAPTSPTASQTYGETEDYCVTIVPNVPCSGNPPALAMFSPTWEICPNSTVALGLSDNYTISNLTYQWQSSTLSAVGPFSNVPSGGNTPSYNTPSITVNTWYQLLVVCPNQGTTAIAANGLTVASTVTNNVRYYEDFELIGINDRLPNCSWTSSSPFNSTRTYTAALSGNRIARSGSSYAAFTNNAGTHEYFTNGIQLEPGITYSVSMWYQTDLAGSNNWSNLKILLGNSQSATGATQVAGVPGSVISPFYKSVSNTFTVNSPGIYYFGIVATANTGGAPFLVWDDFEVMIPCTPQINAVQVIASAVNANICSGNAVSLNATGAHTYTWSNGATGASINDMPFSSTIYSVTGTNTMTSCWASAMVPVTVKPSPLISAVAFPPTSCAGKPVSLTASGGVQYSWSSSGNGSVITVAPTSNTTYSVIGTGTNNCQGTAVVFVSVNENPMVNANTSEVNACVGDGVLMSGLGAQTYQWVAPGGQVLNGSPITAYLYTAGTMTLTGKDANGCEGVANVNIVLEPCTGIDAISQLAGVKVYPNPANADFTVEAAASISEIQIADLTGRVVARIEGGSNKVTVATDALANGIYQVRVTSGESAAVIRLVKE